MCPATAQAHRGTGYPSVVTEDRLSTRRLNRATLERQGLLERHTGGVAAAIGRLAGLQAQHANQPYIALWSRLDDLAIADLQDALEGRAIVRASVMRMTIHLVASVDFAAYDGAVAARRMAQWTSTAREAGVDLAELHGSLLAFCREPRTVAEMEAHLDTIAPDTVAPGGVPHLAFRIASTGGGLVHVPPSGFWGQHGTPRHVAAAQWLGERGAPIDPDAARETAVLRYLEAFGPASLTDIGKWFGLLPVGVLRATIERLGDRLRSRLGDDGRDLLDLADASVPREDRVAPVRFLSRWDSVLISYDQRERILPDAHRAAVAKKNGDILPTFLVDGFVAGLWSVARAKGAATLELTPFGRVGAADRRALEEEGERLVRFVDADASSHEVRWARS